MNGLSTVCPTLLLDSHQTDHQVKVPLLFLESILNQLMSLSAIMVLLQQCLLLKAD